MKHPEAIDILSRVTGALSMLSCVNLLSIQDIKKYTKVIKDIAGSYKEAVGFLIDMGDNCSLQRHWEKAGKYMETFSKMVNVSINETVKSGDAEKADALIEAQSLVGEKIHSRIVEIHDYLESYKETTEKAQLMPQQAKAVQLTTDSEKAQQRASKQPQQQPTWASTDEAKRVFDAAVKKKMLQPLEYGYNALISNALLAYLVEKLCIKDTADIYPDLEASLYFHTKNLKQSRYNYANNKSTNGKPKGYEEIDALPFDL